MSYKVETIKDGTEKYFYIRDLDTMAIEELPSKYLMHKIKCRRSPNTVKRSAFAICYYMGYMEEKEMELTEVYQLGYEKQTEHFVDFLYWLRAGNHTKQSNGKMKKCPNQGTCNAYLKDVFRFYLFIEAEYEQYGSLKTLSYMLHNFIYLKEAMFSKCIIFVEGDTENGAIPVFAKRMGLDMDERGIGVIKLDGADSVKRCMALYKSFGIKSIAIIDKDKKGSYGSEPDIYFTKANDYEEDVYDNFKLTDYLKSCKELSGVEPYIPILRREGLNFNPGQFVENPANIEIDDTLQMKIMLENKDRELQKLKQSKNAAKGAILAGYVTVIPPAFQKIINKLIKEVK